MMCGLEHAANCHGEWNLIGASLVVISTGGFWMRRNIGTVVIKIKTWFVERKVRTNK